MIIDGMINLPRTRKMMPDAPDEKFISPDAIAATAWSLASQDRSGWSFEVDVRPNVENW
jgi:hypothetical protein